MIKNKADKEGLREEQENKLRWRIEGRGNTMIWNLKNWVGATVDPGSITSLMGSTDGKGFLAPSTREASVGMAASRFPTTKGMLFPIPSTGGGFATTTTPHLDATKGISQLKKSSLKGFIAISEIIKTLIK